MRLLIPSSCKCARRVSGRRLIASYSAVSPGKGIATPQQIHGIQLSMVRMRRELMVRGYRTLSEIVVSFFDQRLDLLLRDVERRFRGTHGPGKSIEEDIAAALVSAEAIWAASLDEIFGTQMDIAFVLEYIPAVQSVSAQAYARTSQFLGVPESHNASVTILRRAQEMGRLVTRINDTTRRHLVRVLIESIQEGLTVAETVAEVRAQIPDIQRKRVPTIVRTEIGRAIDEGTKQSMKDSGTVTHVSVIGCAAREDASPQYRGESTCNIQDVPVGDVDLLEFHINHSGTIVPSRFVENRSGPVRL